MTIKGDVNAIEPKDKDAYSQADLAVLSAHAFELMMRTCSAHDDQEQLIEIRNQFNALREKHPHATLTLEGDFKGDGNQTPCLNGFNLSGINLCGIRNFTHAVGIHWVNFQDTVISPGQVQESFERNIWLFNGLRAQTEAGRACKLKGSVKGKGLCNHDLGDLDLTELDDLHNAERFFGAGLEGAIISDQQAQNLATHNIPGLLGYCRQNPKVALAVDISGADFGSKPLKSDSYISNLQMPYAPKDEYDNFIEHRSLGNVNMTRFTGLDKVKNLHLADVRGAIVTPEQVQIFEAAGITAEAGYVVSSPQDTARQRIGGKSHPRVAEISCEIGKGT